VQPRKQRLKLASWAFGDDSNRSIRLILDRSGEPQRGSGVAGEVSEEDALHESMNRYFEALLLIDAHTRSLRVSPLSVIMPGPCEAHTVHG